jgi:uncharacterized protein
VTSTVGYLDASAAVKLMRREPETAALRRALADFAMHVSSELLEVELRCVAHRGGGGALLQRAGHVCDAVALVPCTASIRARAGEAFTPPQRALDALHLATALDLGLDALAVLTYDERQGRAARGAGLEVLTPT